MRNKIVIALVICMAVVFAGVWTTKGVVADPILKQELVYGDTNQDGVCDMGDVTKIQRYILQLDTPLGENLLCGDLNRDGEFSMADVILTERYILGMDPVAAWWVY